MCGIVSCSMMERRKKFEPGEPELNILVDLHPILVDLHPESWTPLASRYIKAHQGVESEGDSGFAVWTNYALHDALL